VSAGKRADLLLVDGDPTQNISDIRHIALVLKDGVAYYPAEIYQAIGIEPFVPAAIAIAPKSSGIAAAESASGK
jgi:hypothetical protein